MESIIGWITAALNWSTLVKFIISLFSSQESKLKIAYDSEKTIAKNGTRKTKRSFRFSHKRSSK